MAPRPPHAWMHAHIVTVPMQHAHGGAIFSLPTPCIITITLAMPSFLTSLMACMRSLQNMHPAFMEPFGSSSASPYSFLNLCAFYSGSEAPTTEAGSGITSTASIANLGQGLVVGPGTRPGTTDVLGVAQVRYKHPDEAAADPKEAMAGAEKMSGQAKAEKLGGQVEEEGECEQTGWIHICIHAAAVGLSLKT